MSATGEDRPLRVLHVASSMGTAAGGPPVICAGIAGALARAGASVTLVTVESPGPQVAVDPAVRQRVFPRRRGGRHARSDELARWLTAHVRDFDVVHVHCVWDFPALAAARACRNAAVPYVILLNGMLERYSVGQRHYWLKRLYWVVKGGAIFRGAAGLQCGNAAEIRRAVPWIAGLPKFVVGNGIAAAELADLPPRGQFRAAHREIAGRPLALFLSRIHPKKGLDRLIPAWAKLAANNPEARLAIAGSGDAEYVAGIDRLIAQHGLEKSVIRVGQLVGPAKWQALVDADIFVLPSHQEGFSMAITEALAAGRPVIATRECNFDELGEERCGILIENGDMGAFVAAAEQLLKDDGQRAAMGARGAALVKSRFTWEGIARDLETVYRWILVGKALPADGGDVWRVARLENDKVTR